ncbi:putative galactose oxidase/kelch, beta-propeller, F-box associated interaction [Helianthus annuus]|nr:putative galactose oxidase/kelch, beta-propeller, F-box associated interaction [Helianthus annuus]
MSENDDAAVNPPENVGVVEGEVRMDEQSEMESDGVRILSHLLHEEEEGLDHDVVEQILIAFDVKDLLRYKAACKSWYSLIKSPWFINLHLNRNYQRDRDNNRLAYRRITSRDSGFQNHHRVVGSFNGLVCVISRAARYGSDVLVGNPLTGEVRQLTPPPSDGAAELCWGFGYDSRTDDYKVILGSHEDDDHTCFQVFSLKSNTWRVIELVEHSRFRIVYGVLFDGSLYWIVLENNHTKKYIISYDISKEVFEEIPLPEDAGDGDSYLGVINNCLCIYERKAQHPFSICIWLMTKHDDHKPSWVELKRPLWGDSQQKYDLVHLLSPGLGCKDYDASWSSRASQFNCWEHMDAPTYVQSLVSPHAAVSLVSEEDPGPGEEDPGPGEEDPGPGEEDPGPGARIQQMERVIFYASIGFLSFMFLKYRLRR